MGKVANEKRKALFAELEKNGYLDKPLPKKYSTTRTLAQRPKLPRKKRMTVARPPRVSGCCIDAFSHKLPEFFVRCANCPEQPAP